MAELRYPTQTRAGTRAEVDQGLKSYMLGVYNYMALGVAVTAVLILATFTIPALGAVTKVLAFPAMLAVLALGWFGPRMVFSGSVGKAHVVYWAYVAAWGIGIAPIVNRYLGIDPSMVMSAFLTAAITFGAMSVWGYTSKKDLSGMANTVGMIMMGLLIAALVNLVVSLFVGFTATGMMISILISAAFVVLVSLLTAWETQMVKELYYAGDEAGTQQQKSIFGAFALYGSFVSIFVNLLQIFGFLGGGDE
jgi:FtsH-binding integral membrane protein